MDAPARAHVLASRITALCGPPSRWRVPVDYGYQDSLALCVIDSIQSIGVNYGSVENVVQRYRQHRGEAVANTDGAPELLATFSDLGEDGWAETIGNRNRTFSRKHAPLKTHVIHRAAKALTCPGIGIDTAAQFRDRADDPTVRAKWTSSLPSQSSALSWHYALMLAGVPGVKPDRMIRRFTAASLGVPEHSLSDTDLVTLVTDAAAILGAPAHEADYAIWLYQSGRLKSEQ